MERRAGPRVVCGEIFLDDSEHPTISIPRLCLRMHNFGLC
jgi:hypothetical protein